MRDFKDGALIYVRRVGLEAFLQHDGRDVTLELIEFLLGRGRPQGSGSTPGAPTHWRCPQCTVTLTDAGATSSWPWRWDNAAGVWLHQHGTGCEVRAWEQHARAPLDGLCAGATWFEHHALNVRTTVKAWNAWVDEHCPPSFSAWAAEHDEPCEKIYAEDRGDPYAFKDGAEKPPGGQARIPDGGC